MTQEEATAFLSSFNHRSNVSLLSDSEFASIMRTVKDIILANEEKGVYDIDYSIIINAMMKQNQLYRINSKFPAYKLRELPEVISAQGRTARQVERTENYYIYEVTLSGEGGNAVFYEGFKRRIQPFSQFAKNPEGYTHKVAYPCDEAFGVSAWCCWTLSAARKRCNASK